MNNPGTLRAEGLASIMIDKPTRALLKKQAAANYMPVAHYVRKLVKTIDESDGKIPTPDDERLVSPIAAIRADIAAQNERIAAEMADKEIDKPPISENVHKLFCQHCKALQKTNNTIVECWYNPLDEDKAFCAANLDAVEALVEQARAEVLKEVGKVLWANGERLKYKTWQSLNAGTMPEKEKGR